MTSPEGFPLSYEIPPKAQLSAAEAENAAFAAMQTFIGNLLAHVYVLLVIWQLFLFLA